MQRQLDSIIRFSATVAQVKTMADGGLRLTLDLSENEIDVAAQMMKAKRAGAILEIALVATEPNNLNREKGLPMDFNFVPYSFENLAKD